MRAEDSGAAAATDTCTLLSLSPQHSCAGVHFQTARNLAIHRLNYHVTLLGFANTLTVVADARTALHPIRGVVATNHASSGAQENMTCSEQLMKSPSLPTYGCIMYIFCGARLH